MQVATSSEFTRTTQGKIALYRFFDEPLVWLEGGTDYPMFEPLLRPMNCKLRFAGGKRECLKLAQAMIDDDLPYVVVVDGDYEILRRQRSYHRRALLLRRYSIENYCAEPVLIGVVCQRYSEGRVADGDAGERFEELLGQLERELRAMVVLDIALSGKHGGDEGGVLPKSIVSVLATKVPMAFDRAKVREIVTRGRRNCRHRASRRKANALLDGYMAKRRFVDILRGHWVFEMIRWFVVGELRRVEMKMHIDNRGLRALLGSEMWREGESQDHRSVRRGLQRAVREVKGMLPT